MQVPPLLWSASRRCMKGDFQTLSGHYGSEGNEGPESAVGSVCEIFDSARINHMLSWARRHGRSGTPPQELLDYAVVAEQAGLESIDASDYFHPVPKSAMLASSGVG
jgi:hypothetical protein